MKGLIVVIAACMVLSCAPGFAASSPPSIQGTWTVTGSATVTSSTSGLFSLKATILKNQEINDTWVFASGTLVTDQLGTVGPYTVNKQGQVTIPTSELIPAIQAAVIGDLPQDLSAAVVTVTSLTTSPITVKATNTTATFSSTSTANLTIEGPIFFNTQGQTVTAVTQVQVVLSGVKVSSQTLTLANEGKHVVDVISKFIANKVVTPMLSRISTK